MQAQGTSPMFHEPSPLYDTVRPAHEHYAGGREGSGADPWGPTESVLSPDHEDLPIWNILPSYQLYQSTFSKNLLVSDEDLLFEPPCYDGQPLASVSLPETPQDYFAGVFTADGPGGSLGTPDAHPMAANNPNTTRPPMMTALLQTTLDPLPTRWENSIHGNTHKLKRLPSSGTKASKLRMAITLTEKPGVPGRPVTGLIDPKTIEFKQHDTINGFVTVTNTSDKPIPFSMFFVVFEGKVSVRKPGGADINDPKYALVYYKFLNMFDYNASWTPANLDSTFHGLSVDPLDNSVLRFPSTGRLFEPRVTYKKYFSFKIPSKLLDAACEDHNLPLHCEIQPSIGLPRDQFLIEVRKLRAGGSHGTSANGAAAGIAAGIAAASSHAHSGAGDVLKAAIKDMSFPDTAISYSVEARVVGRASTYPDVFKDKQFHSIVGDEFIIVDEESCFVRLVPNSRPLSDKERVQLLKESKLGYEDLLKRTTDALQLGRELQGGNSMGSPSSRCSTPSVTTVVKHKRPQLYNRRSASSSSSLLLDSSCASLPPQGDSSLLNSDFYHISTPVIKKLISSSKLLGDLTCKVPKSEFVFPYATPLKFQSKLSKPTANSTGVNIPIEFIFKGIKPPEIKLCHVELVAFTYRSKKYPVSIQLYHDLMFKNKPHPSNHSSDNFDYYVVEPFQRYLDELTSLSKQFGLDILNIDRQLVMDIKSIAKLQPKFNTLKVEQVILSPVKWTKLNSGVNDYTSKNNLAVDLKNLKTEKGEEICLVPTFQNCILGRLYYLKVTISVQNTNNLIVKIPISIEKPYV